MAVVKKKVYSYPIRIRYKGLYDYDGLLALIRGFYARHKFMKLDEPKFKYKVGGGGAEVEFKFHGDRKITHYIRAHLYVEGHMWNVKRQEVVENGKKVIRTNGRAEFKISGEFELDYRNRFKEVKPGAKAYDKFYHGLDKWMQSKLDDEGVGLQYENNKTNGKNFVQKLLIKLSDEIKTFLKMECV